MYKHDPSGNELKNNQASSGGKAPEDSQQKGVTSPHFLLQWEAKHQLGFKIWEKRKTVNNGAKQLLRLWTGVIPK